jgi:hypothetical protein
LFWTDTIGTMRRARSISATETSERPRWPDLPFLLERAQRAELLVLRHRGVDAMELPEVDALEAQPAQAAFELFAQALRPAARLPSLRSRPIEAALGGDHEAGRVRMQRRRDQLFADVRAVRLGGVDEVDAELHRAAEHGDRFLLVGGGAPDPGAR